MEEEFDKLQVSYKGKAGQSDFQEDLLIDDEQREEIKSFIKSSHKSLLKKIAEEEVEMLESGRKELRYPEYDPVDDQEIGYNQALQDQITHWKEIISKLD